MTATYSPPPPPPAPEAPAKKKMKTRTKVILGFVAGAVLIIFAASAGAGGAKKDDAVVSVAPTNEIPAVSVPVTEAPKAEDPVAVKAENTVGSTDNTADWDVTVNSVINPYTAANQFLTADPGKHYVAVDVSMKNTGKRQDTVSSLLMVELTDSQGFKYTESMGGMDLPQLGGTTDPGGITRGWVTYEVPDTATGLVLRVKGSFTATGTTFSLS